MTSSVAQFGPYVVTLALASSLQNITVHFIILCFMWPTAKYLHLLYASCPAGYLHILWHCVFFFPVCERCFLSQIRSMTIPASLSTDLTALPQLTKPLCSIFLLQNLKMFWKKGVHHCILPLKVADERSSLSSVLPSKSIMQCFAQAAQHSKENGCIYSECCSKAFNYLPRTLLFYFHHHFTSVACLIFIYSCLDFGFLSLCFFCWHCENMSSRNSPTLICLPGFPLLSLPGLVWVVQRLEGHFNVKL